MSLPFVLKEKEALWAEIEGLFETLDEENISRGIAMAEEAGIEVPWGEWFYLFYEEYSQTDLGLLSRKIELINSIFGKGELKNFDEEFPENLELVPRVLKRLTLDLGDLDFIDPVLFEFRQLNFLDLNIPNVKVLPSAISNFERLRRLEIVSDELSGFPESFCTLSNLEVLVLRLKKCKVLPRSISELPNLRELQLIEWRELSSFQFIDGHFSNLKELFISNAPKFNIDPISIRSSRVEKLRFVNIDDDLSSVDFSQFECLKDLEISSNNSLESVPESLKNLEKLESIDFHDTKVSSLPDWIYEKLTLRVIILRGTELMEISPQLSKLQSLEHLDLSKSYLLSFPLESLASTNLKTINLSRTVFLGDRNPDINSGNTRENLDIKSKIQELVPTAQNIICRYVY